MPWPSNGAPIMVPLKSDQTHLPAQMGTTFSVAFSSPPPGGTLAPDIFTVAFQVPRPAWMLSSSLDRAPLAEASMGAIAAGLLARLRVSSMHWISLPSGPFMKHVSTELSLSLKTIVLRPGPLLEVQEKFQVLAFSS